MNRRSFFRSLGIATAAVYLRIAPEKIAVVADLRIDGQLTAYWYQTTRSTFVASPAYKAALDRIFADAEKRGKLITIPFDRAR